MNANTLVLASLILCLLFSGCSDLLVNEPASDQNLADFQRTWEIAATNYPFFEFKKINWDSLYSVYRPRAQQSRGDEIYLLLSDLLSYLKDGHVTISTEGGYEVSTFVSPRFGDRRAFSPEVIRRYFKSPLRLAGGNRIAYGFIISSIGYIHFSTFKKGNWVVEVDGIMEYFSNASKMIIDVRNNTGGSSSSYDFVISRFANTPIKETFIFKSGETQSWTIKPSGKFPSKDAVVILINGASFSGSEVFAELMRQLPYTIVVGDTSGGGGGAVRTFTLPSGKRLQIPIKYFVRLDGRMVEWNGIIPDIVVEQSEADIIQARDRQLETAVNLLK